MKRQESAPLMSAAGAKACVFCSPATKKRMVAKLASIWAIADRYPVTPGHHLIIPQRHTPDWFSMTDDERNHAQALIVLLKERLAQTDSTITGFNIGMNCGRSAGQTIFHAHIHLIPRRNGDIADPTGGVRGVIPARMSYRTTPA